jgi:hypothetical protein
MEVIRFGSVAGSEASSDYSKYFLDLFIILRMIILPVMYHQSNLNQLA